MDGRRRLFTNEEYEGVNLYINAAKMTFEIAAWALIILISFSCIVSTGVMYLDTLDQLYSNLYLIKKHKILNPFLTHAMNTL